VTGFVTERLILRPAATADVPALHELWAHPDVRRYLWDDTITPLEEVKGLVAESEQTMSVSGMGLWLVLTRDETFIGFCGLRKADDWLPGEIELMYGLHPDYWGTGFATEASLRLLEHAFVDLKLSRVVAALDTPNRASARVLERVGMTFERAGEIDGMPTLFYAFSAEDYFRSVRRE
jgi:[ribosomal protein S5]-alanine N-acetyltransferase